MMERISGILALVFSAAVVLSCGRTTVTDADILPYVSETVSDTSSMANSVVRHYDPYDRNGTIAVMGPEEDTRRLTEFLMECDMFDNVDGKHLKDSLPDFAGEVFHAWYDIADTSYAAFFEEGNDDMMREVTARNAVIAAAAECYQNTFSHSPSVPKVPSKIIVFSSPYAEAGREDADSLFSYMGKEIRIVSPVRAVAESLLEARPASRIGIWADSDVLASGVYAKVFRDLNCAVDYVGFSPDGYATAEEGFFRYLDMYIATGEITPLSAVVIDDLSLSSYAGYISVVARRVKSSSEDEYAVYRAVLADDFAVFDAVSSLAASCYRMMREHNLFSHRILYPRMEEYMILPASDGDTGVKYVEYNHIYVH